MRLGYFTGLLGLLALGSAAAADEWIELFDGKSLAGWVDARGAAPINGGWNVQDGVLHHSKGGGDLFSAIEYADFEFSFEWKVAAGANSGVKYRVTKIGAAMLGPEYQLLDDAKHPNGKVAKTSAAAMYELFAPDPQAKPPGSVVAGVWQASRIVVKGNHFQHWLNGKLVVSIEVGSPAWDAALSQSKFKAVPGFARNPRGRLMLQDHGNEVWFRSLRLRQL